MDEPNNEVCGINEQIHSRTEHFKTRLEGFISRKIDYKHPLLVISHSFEGDKLSLDVVAFQDEDNKDGDELTNIDTCDDCMRDIAGFTKRELDKHWQESFGYMEGYAAGKGFDKQGFKEVFDNFFNRRRSWFDAKTIDECEMIDRFRRGVALYFMNLIDYEQYMSRHKAYNEMDWDAVPAKREEVLANQRACI